MAEEHVKWRGIRDWIIGTVDIDTDSATWRPAEAGGTVYIKRIDGVVCGPVDKSRLHPASHDEVLWACWLGGCTIPLTGKPPTDVPGIRGELPRLPKDGGSIYGPERVKGD